MSPTRGAVAIAITALLLGACSSGGAESTPSRFVGTWTGPDGEPASTDSTFEIVTRAGPEHCDWGSATFMTVAWPVGREAERIGDDGEVRRFVRDPRGAVDPQLADALDLDATLPDTAEATGYHLGDAELWLSPEGQFAYVVTAERTERWPPVTTACS